MAAIRSPKTLPRGPALCVVSAESGVPHTLGLRVRGFRANCKHGSRVWGAAEPYQDSDCLLRPTRRFHFQLSTVNLPSDSSPVLAISHHPNHLHVTLDIRYQYAIMVSLSRHDPSACPPYEGALRTMLTPRGPSNINNFALPFRFPFWNSPHFVHFPFFSYTYGKTILQPLCFYGLPYNGGMYTRSPAFQWSSSNAPKSFICNTYGSPRNCCKQKTYDMAKSFSCNTYKKHGGGGGYG